MTCEAELLGSVTRMVYSILSLIGSDHQRVSHNRGKAICQAFPHSQALVMMGLPLEESRSGLHITKEQVDFLDERLYVPDL